MAALNLRFDGSLDYQQDAIAAVADLFTGLPAGNPVFSISYNNGLGLNISELGVANPVLPDDQALLTNLQAVQERNGITKVGTLTAPEFAVEMETGTGKTYVYLRTAFELNKRYGFTKFVIVVPSVPIREGVLHSIRTMSEHFRTLYGTPFDYFTYESKRANQIRSFAMATTMQIMVINIQAFQRDFKEDDTGKKSGGNVIYREQDRLNGWRPIDFLQETRPFVIVDEPQKVQGTASQVALGRLNPSCVVQYSATFDSQNKVYRLGPIEAHQQKLVKQIEVASVLEEFDGNQAYVKLLKVDIDKRRAQVEINVGKGDGIDRKAVWVKQRDDLHTKSGERLEYEDNWVVDNMSFDPVDGYIDFANGQSIALGDDHGSLDEDVMRAQVVETVREHLDKELRLNPQGIKVLSLFFIDRVANYRIYNDDNSIALGKIGQWFEEAYRDLTTKYERFASLKVEDVSSTHGGYFSIDRQKRAKDTSGKTADDESTYDLIMRDKEKLLSFTSSIRFIFSHSALREGWDNPNVFQICTLKETKSIDSKRQEIGRGLRLPVDQTGERIHDQSINRLTVIANESYKDFAASLQKEYATEAGIRFGVVPENAFSLIEVRDSLGAGTQIGQAADNRIREHLIVGGYLGRDSAVLPKFRPDMLHFELNVPQEYESIKPQITDVIRSVMFTGNQIHNARDRRSLQPNKQVLLDPGFNEFWNAIAKKTRYRVQLDSEELIADASLALRDKARPIRAPQIGVETRTIAQSYRGIEAADAARRTATHDARIAYDIPDVLAYLQNETELTRKTLTSIIQRSQMIQKLVVNPQAFLNAAVGAIHQTLQNRMLPGIIYEEVPGSRWQQRLLEEAGQRELSHYLERLYEVQSEKKTIWDYVPFDSAVEQKFAADLDANDAVSFFIKLPSWFKVDTPIGTYNPDWAISLERGFGHDLYFISETKSTLDSRERRETENIKIDCGRKHFDAIGVNYVVGTTLTQAVREAEEAPYRV